MTDDHADQTVPTPHITILSALIGSHAYGLATETSDEDRYGIFLVPNRALLGIHPITETIARHDPDLTMHEVGKFVRLAMKANPTVLDLLFVEAYETLHPAGQLLVARRSLFISQLVREAFGGYAVAQARKLAARGDTFSSDTRNRTAKHARHCFRLMRQGRELLETGTMSLRVPDRAALFALGELPPAEIVARFEDEYARFREVESSLPERPDLDAINDLLLEIRETWG